MVRERMRAPLAILISALLGCSAASEPAGPVAGGRGEPSRSEPRAVSRPPASARPPLEAEPPEGAAEPRFLKGQTHVHTGRSYDAHTPPDEVLRFYAERGYDFVAITDHNRITVVEPPDGLMLIPGVELTQNSADCDPKPIGGYRCLFHTTALFVDPAKDKAQGKRFGMQYEPRRVRAYRAQLDLTEALGGIPVLNHPLFHFAADAKLVRTLAESELVLVELFNASVDRQHPAGRERAEDRAERLWDEVLSAGTLVYAVATDDAHHFSDAPRRKKRGKFAYTGDHAWIMVEAEKTPQAIQQALRAGRFYATTGVSLKQLQLSRARLSFSIDGPGAGGAVTRFIGRAGQELARVTGAAASYSPRGNEGYVRAVVRLADGKKAWTQPVWLADD